MVAPLPRRATASTSRRRSPRRSSARGAGPERRARTGDRPRRRATVAFVREFALAHRAAARARRRRARRVRRRRSALAARSGATVLTPHAGELARCSRSRATRGRPTAAALRARTRRARPARSSCSRATTRSSPTRTGASRSAGAALPRSRPPAPAMSSRAWSARTSQRAWSRSAAAAPPCTSTPPRGRLVARELGAEGVIACDVIAALPAARSIGAEEPEDGDAGARRRSTSRRSSATSPPCARGLRRDAAVRGRQGRRATATGRCRSRGRRSPPVPRMLAVATAQEALELRLAGIDAPIIVMGAVSSDELPRRARGARGARRLGRAFRRDGARAADRRAGPAARQARHRHGSLRHARSRGRRCAIARAIVDAAPGARARRRMTHFATADSDQEFVAASARRRSRRSSRRCARSPPTS